MNSAKGFTLIELLAVIGILGVISALAFPAFNYLLEKEQASAFSYKLYRYLNYARSEAITKNITTTVCASKNNLDCSKNKDWSNQHILIFIDFNSNGKRDQDDIIVKAFELGLSNNSLVWRSFGNKNYLQWQPSGMTYYQNGNFTYCPDNKDIRNAKKIILNAAGRIYFGMDRNHDGIQEGTDGKNVICT
jgi:type IV fimbrial biogenesis protein FimT